MRLLLFIVFGVVLAAPPGWGKASDEPLFQFSKKQEDALVVKVTGADTLVLEDGRKIKLIGVEAAPPPPRKYAERDKNGMIIAEPEEPDIPLEEQAVSYAQDLLEGKKVRLEYDIEGLSPDGRHWAYVFLPDGRMANVEMLRQGFVYLRIRPPNLKHEQDLRAAYQEGKREQRGFLGS